MCYVMMIVGIYLIVNGIGDYAGQSRQKDWIPIEATVTDVSSEVVSSSPGRHGSNSSTYYIKANEYADDGTTYTSHTRRKSTPRQNGTVITVKYNPEVPDENTAILSPYTHNLLVL